MGRRCACQKGKWKWGPTKCGGAGDEASLILALQCTHARLRRRLFDIISLLLFFPLRYAAPGVLSLPVTSCRFPWVPVSSRPCHLHSEAGQLRSYVSTSDSTNLSHLVSMSSQMGPFFPNPIHAGRLLAPRRTAACFVGRTLARLKVKIASL